VRGQPTPDIQPRRFGVAAHDRFPNRVSCSGWNQDYFSIATLAQPTASQACFHDLNCCGDLVLWFGL